MEYSVEQAKMTDIDSIKRCINLAYEKYIPVLGKKPAAMMTDYEKSISGQQVFVIKEKDTVIAVVILIGKENYLELSNLAVLPGLQNKGIGSFMLSFAEIKACQCGYGELRLYTNILLTDLIRFYKKLGFIEYARKEEKGYNRIYFRKIVKKNLENEG